MLAGMKSWYMVASSEGRNAERMRLVPLWVGFPSPLFSKVSEARLVVRWKVYGLVLTLPFAA